MAYTRVNWEDTPSENTPISSENLNKMDSGISEVDKKVSEIINGATQAGDSKKLGGKGAEEYAPSTHKHTKSEITDFPTTMPPTAHSHTISEITNFPTSMPASDVYAWAKASEKPAYTKSEIGLDNVDNTADSEKSVAYAANAGSATNATQLGGTTASGYAKTTDLSKYLALSQKPSGSYTGNSSSATRTINIGGVGQALLLRSANTGYSAIVDYDGAIGHAGETVTAYDASKINFRNGVLTIATTAININSSNQTYYYQVL